MLSRRVGIELVVLCIINPREYHNSVLLPTSSSPGDQKTPLKEEV